MKETAVDAFPAFAVSILILAANFVVNSAWLAASAVVLPFSAIWDSRACSVPSAALVTHVF